MNKLTVGTRGSKLALTQTKWVVSELKKHYKNLDVDIKIIKTKGDLITDIPLEKIGDKGLFVKEIEDQILDGRIDFSVNSLKDMPADLPSGLGLASFPKAEDHRDALVTTHDVSSLLDLPKGATVATGSKRRQMQIKQARQDIELVGIRGNVETRIDKMIANGYDGAILAMAGLNRIGYKKEGVNIIPIENEIMVCAPCQGILALEVRANDKAVKEILACLSDEMTQLRANVERGFLSAIEGGCHTPTGGYCEMFDENIKLTGLFGDDEKIVRKTITANKSDYKIIAKRLAASIKGELK